MEFKKDEHDCKLAQSLKPLSDGTLVCFDCSMRWFVCGKCGKFVPIHDAVKVGKERYCTQCILKHKIL